MSPIARKENNSVTTLKMGIASYEEMKSRTMAVARGTRCIGANDLRSGSPPRSHLLR